MNLFLFFLALLFLVFFVWHLAATNDRSRRGTALALIGSLLLLCGISLFSGGGKDRPWPVNITPGLDLQGGTQFTLQLSGNPSSSALDQAVEVIRKRIDDFGTREPMIQPTGDNKIIVQIPGISESDKERYRQQLERVAKLEFKLVDPLSDQLLPGILAGTEEVPFDDELLPYVTHEGKEGASQPRYILVKKRAVMSGRYVDSAMRGADQLNRPTVLIDFDSEGKKLFTELTAANVGRQLAIVLDGEVYSAPVIRGIISGSCEISGGSMTPTEAEELASVLENPLETPVKILDERGVDPTLGKASVRDGFKAALIGFVLVMVFMLFYYRLSGAFAALALLMNLFILLGLLAQFGFTLTLPGVAGIILTIGMAVDANVLIFERIREELEAGNPPLAAVGSGFNKAFSSIMDANVTTLIAAVIMFWQGSGAIQGFAVVLCLGIVSSLFTALIVTRTCYDWLFTRGVPARIVMMRLFSGAKFDFMGVRYAAIAVSLLLFLASAGVWIQKGDKALGVDFVGGDLMTLGFEQKVPDDQLRSAIGSTGAVIQYQRSPGTDEEVLGIKTAFGQAESVQAELEKTFPEAKFSRLSLDKVQAVIGNEFKEKAVVALVLGVIGIFLYVMWRFEFSFAVGAIVALVHDVVITLGIFAMIGHEFSLTTVGALLTIAGYSINDTIVVFDRIREGLRRDGRTPMRELINQCVNATLSRTLLTSGTTLLAVIALYLFGGLVINDFALMLMVGIIVGTYSSIFIASPIMLLFGESTRRSVERHKAAAVEA